VFIPLILIFRQSKWKREKETIRKKKKGGLSKSEKIEKKTEEQRF
jgi:hypothetical protein